MTRSQRSASSHEGVGKMPTGRFPPVTTWARCVRRLLLLAGLVGCGSHASEGSTGGAEKPIEECETYAASYEHCLSELGPPDIAKARVGQLRDALKTEAARGGEARASVRQKCVANLANLQRTCR